MVYLDFSLFLCLKSGFGPDEKKTLDLPNG